ncbi:Replication protein A 70 kDa DNA-binding subunit [Spatholobus suberectus]|nr:Replication protein A 70 kDa DNA-binding subunit [Spatholobus suberectus]
MVVFYSGMLKVATFYQLITDHEACLHYKGENQFEMKLFSIDNIEVAYPVLLDNSYILFESEDDEENEVVPNEPEDAINNEVDRSWPKVLSKADVYRVQTMVIPARIVQDFIPKSQKDIFVQHYGGRLYACSLKGGARRVNERYIAHGCKMVPRISFIKKIVPGTIEWRLRVRIIRLWNQTEYNNPMQIKSIELILLDEKTTRIQATIKRSLIEQFETTIEEGSAYSIENLLVAETDPKFKATKHKFKLHVNVIDSTGSATFVLFDRVVSQFFGNSAIDMIHAICKDNNDENEADTKREPSTQVDDNIEVCMILSESPSSKSSGKRSANDLDKSSLFEDSEPQASTTKIAKVAAIKMEPVD